MDCLKILSNISLKIIQLKSKLTRQNFKRIKYLIQICNCHKFNSNSHTVYLFWFKNHKLYLKIIHFIFNKILNSFFSFDLNVKHFKSKMFKQFKKTLLVLFVVSVSHYSFAYSKKPIEVRESTCFNETCYNNLSDIDNSPLVNCSYL